MLLIPCLYGFCCLASPASDPVKNRWSILPSGGITWVTDNQIPHFDHIEMSGEQISTVLRYGVDSAGAFILERSFVWPMLRTVPNNTHASLMRRFGWNVVADMLTVNGRRIAGEQVKSITLDGVMSVVSEYAYPRNGKLVLTRYLFPSPDKAAFCEKYVLLNAGTDPVSIEIPDAQSVTKTNREQGVDGEYLLEAIVQGAAGRFVASGDSIVFYANYQAHGNSGKTIRVDVEQELKARRTLIAQLWDHLILETPDETVNRMFAFAKIRASESIYKTKGGYMHGPGGESYYAAIWANDQAEYVNPFFPFLGYDKGNQSAGNSFRHFARFMNDDYRPVPSSVIAEGDDIWNGAGDRGDAAMIAYGAARYALAKSDRDEAESLWPLIEWCLEYCRRQVNDRGVVASDSDELEGRFPAGKANLSTSSLYYDALLSAVYLGKDLGKPASRLAAYARQAKEIRAAIERYFGGNVEGFNTYKYYEGNDVLRSWICIPLTMGINERKDETVKALFSPRLWTENGLLTQAGSETFWDRSTLYALRGVYACGETEKATAYLKFYANQRLLGEHVPYAIEAWPEGSQRHLSAESGLYCRIITEGLFGIRPTGLRSFTVTPRLPKDWDTMSLRNIYAFGNLPLDIHVYKQAKGLKIEVYAEGKLIRTHTGKDGETLTVRNVR
jgi:hypothetical protein